jgi:putative YhbY family RNA-binding protein
MPPLDSAARRALRARAHHLDPVVSIGQQGLTPTVMHEIDIALTAHELIKVRVFGDDRAARGALLETICAATDAAAVQHLGKLLVLWRPAPAPEKAASRRAPRDPSRKPGPKGARGGTMKKIGGKGRDREATKEIGSKGRDRDATKKIGSKGRDRDATKKVASKGRDRDATKRVASKGRAPRDAPPAGVPRAALPRRRRARS